VSSAQAPTYFRLLSAEQVQGLLSMDELIDAMRVALQRFSASEVLQPVRTVLPVGESAFFGGWPRARLRSTSVTPFLRCESVASVPSVI
jgi:hypothetical protein